MTGVVAESNGLPVFAPKTALGTQNQNLFAAQLMAAAERRLPDLEARIGVGDFTGLLDWLRQHVHGFGRTLDSEPLIEQATGEPASERFFLDSLRRRYGPAHGL